MFVVCWTLYMIDPAPFIQLMHPDFTGGTDGIANFVNGLIEHHLGSTSTTLFFLMGAMTIVEIVDQNGGFDWVRKVMKTKSKRSLLWKIAVMTFILSAILDNLTTSIVMIMILRKLVKNHNDRIIYASLVIISANSGGAFSPIGDVTTIMLWNKGLITAAGVITEILIPSVVSMVIPAAILSTQLKGELNENEQSNNVLECDADTELLEFDSTKRKIIFCVGVGGLIFVPVFKSITHLPPFTGILLVLGTLWIVTEVFYRQLHKQTGKNHTFSKRVNNLLSRIDMSTILFFLGILMAVSALSEVGVLTTLADSMNTHIHQPVLMTSAIGALSSIVDNVPLVSACIKMFEGMAPAGTTDPYLLTFVEDGLFWHLLTFCAGVGGSLLIIGSAAGVVAMGIEKIPFFWYVKRISLLALAGYLAGIAIIWLESLCPFFMQTG